MSGTWFVLAALGPPVAVAAAAALRSAEAPPKVAIAVNALVPGAGLALLGRPLLEVVLGTLVSITSLLVIGGVADLAMWVPIMAIGGFWASLHTPLSPIAGSRGTPPSAAGDSSPSPPVRRGSPRTPPASGSEDHAVADEGYAVSVRCTECGAEVEVPVLQRMAQCSFCGSEHLVVGHEDVLDLAIPSRIGGADDLREAALDHYRYQRYLELYRRRVAPLERQSQEAEVGIELIGGRARLATGGGADLAAAAAERAVSRQADAYRDRLARDLRLSAVESFHAPYLHGLGTLYQAGFGRVPTDQEKALRFAVGTIQGATLGTSDVDLPPMGKLSYLKALVPAAQLGDEARVLPCDEGDDARRRAYGDLDRKQLVRDINLIDYGSAFVEEIRAVVWRPWWVATVSGAGIDETLLVDGGAGTVAGVAPPLPHPRLAPLPERARSAGNALRFLPMECPTCGAEFTFDVNAVVHFCTSCYRTFTTSGTRKVEIPYQSPESFDPAQHDLLPYWRFDLRLRTADGTVVTDLWHLKDGIDGTLDQIGEDAPMARHAILLPALRCTNAKLTATAMNRLLVHALTSKPQLRDRRFDLDLRPRPWAVSLDADEARRVLPLCLANVFSPRDIARVNIHQVRGWLFDSRQESPGRLCYLAVPRPVAEPFRGYTGRIRPPALDRS